jgi:replicative DNA helicase
VQNEIRVLSAVVNERDIAPLVRGSNVDQLFTSFGDVWMFMKQYYQQHRQIVPKDILVEKFDNEELPYRFKLVETSGTVKHYLEQLRDDYKANMLERMLRGASSDLGRKSNDDLIQQLNRRLSDLTKVSTAVRDLDITDGSKAVEHYLEVKKLMDENGGVLGTRFGYDSIDANYPTGKGSGHYIMILSRTNQGKSWIALDFALNAWAQGKKVVYASLEMSPELVRDRAFALMSAGAFSMSDLARAQIDINQMQTWASDRLRADNSFVVIGSDTMGDFTPAALQAKIDQYAPDEVYIDYIQLMSDNKGSSGATERIRNVSKELKATAIMNEIAVIGVASASSHETKEYFSPPQIYEVAESRQSAYDCDLVLALISKKQSDGSNLTEIIARKNRHGPLFDFILRMDIANGKISEEWGSEDDEEE